MNRSFNIYNLHDVRLIRSVLVGAMDANDLTACLDQVMLFCDFDNSLDNVITALVGWNLVAPDTSYCLKVSNDRTDN